MCATTPTRNEPPDDDPYDRLDFSRLRFPSDRLSIQDLRRLFPDLFDHGLRRDGEVQPHFFPHATFKSRLEFNIGERLLGAMLFSERLIAAHAYARASGLPEPQDWEGEVGLSGFKDDLVENYIDLGLASGEHQAKELIRDIERQAMNLSPDLGRSAP